MDMVQQVELRELALPERRRGIIRDIHITVLLLLDRLEISHDGQKEQRVLFLGLYARHRHLQINQYLPEAADKLIHTFVVDLFQDVDVLEISQVRESQKPHALVPQFVLLLICHIRRDLIKHLHPSFSKAICCCVSFLVSPYSALGGGSSLSNYFFFSSESTFSNPLKMLEIIISEYFLICSTIFYWISFWS